MHHRAWLSARAPHPRLYVQWLGHNLVFLKEFFPPTHPEPNYFLRQSRQEQWVLELSVFQPGSTLTFQLIGLN
jgi:hypothetical protein